MDANCFDELTKRLATGGASRRRLLRGLGGGLLGALGLGGRRGAAAVTGRPGGATCLKDAQCCSERCDSGTYRCECVLGQVPCGPRCCAAGQVCTDAVHGQCCAPATICPAGACGPLPNGCGGTLECGCRTARPVRVGSA